jgi:hypothetical protein
MTLDYTKRVYVYWNLHRKLWSVRQAGKVVDHSHLLSLRDCKFLVGKAGQARVRRERKKNVHAGVSGYLLEDPCFVDRAVWNGCYDKKIWVKYNPYKNDTFVERTGVCDDTHPRPVHTADFVLMYKQIELGLPNVMALEPNNMQSQTAL